MANWGKDEGGSWEGSGGARSRAGTMVEYQSVHVPIRSKTRALGPDAGAWRVGDIGG